MTFRLWRCFANGHQYGRQGSDYASIPPVSLQLQLWQTSIAVEISVSMSCFRLLVAIWCNEETVCRWCANIINIQPGEGAEWPALLKSLSEYWPNIDTQACIHKEYN